MERSFERVCGPIKVEPDLRERRKASEKTKRVGGLQRGSRTVGRDDQSVPFEPILYVDRDVLRDALQARGISLSIRGLSSSLADAELESLQRLGTLDSGPSRGTSVVDESRKAIVLDESNGTLDSVLEVIRGVSDPRKVDREVSGELEGCLSSLELARKGPEREGGRDGNGDVQRDEEPHRVG